MRRYTASDPCPVCSGHPGLPQGRGIRCWGFEADDGRFVRCSREEHAGDIDAGDLGRFVHVFYFVPNRIQTDQIFRTRCACGVIHRPELPDFVEWCGDGRKTSAQPQRRPRPASKSDAPAKAEKPLKPWTLPDNHIEMTHDYLDEGGLLAWQVVRFKHEFRERYPGKTMPRHHGGDGGWYWGQGQWRGRRDKPLYQQADAIAELEMGGTLYLVDGERDVDTLRDLNRAATCAGSMGCLNQHHAGLIATAMTESYASQRSRLIIVADRDASGDGERHARSAFRKILEAAPELVSRVRLVRPKEAKDISEINRGERQV